MAVCKDCNKDMLDPESQSCSLNILVVAERNGHVLERYFRNTTYFDAGERCHDCGILNNPGNVHHYSCDMERCPKCGLQLISCSCFVGKRIFLTTKEDPVCQGNAEIKQPVEAP